MGAFRQNIAVDLGSANIRINVEKKGVLVDEPCLVTIRKDNGEVKAIGRESRNMLGKTDEGIITIKPVSRGAISEYTVAVNLVGYFLDRAITGFLLKFIRPDVITAVHSNATSVDKRATERALREAGAGRIFFVEAPLAAAVGANLQVSEPTGRLIVNIGAEITDIAVVSFDGIVSAVSVPVGGRSFDEAIKNYFKREYKMLLGDVTAERIKKENVCIFRDCRIEPFEVSAFELTGRLPKDVTATPEELIKPLSECAAPNIEGISRVLEQTPPELVSDVAQRGITLTGAGAKLAGMDAYVEAGTGIMTRLADNPQHSVVNGCIKILSNMSNESKNELTSK